MGEDPHDVRILAATGPCGAAACAVATITVSPAISVEPQFIAGFVVAEGAFLRAGRRPTFTFAIGLGAIDSELCMAIRTFFGVGTVMRFDRREDHFDDAVTYQVRKLSDLMEVIVPFMNEHLPPSYKRHQYELWRDHLTTYWETRARRVRACMAEGCNEPRRAYGLCRHHLYLATGR